LKPLDGWLHGFVYKILRKRICRQKEDHFMNTSSEMGTPPVAMDAGFIEAVIGYARIRRCTAGTELIATGEAADCFYYVEKGTFEVSYQAQQTPIVVALIGTGDFFGEVGFFDQLARTRTVRALVEADVRVFDREVMGRIKARDPFLYSTFLEVLLAMLSRRFRQVLSDRVPLTAYAASLSTGKEHFKGVQAIPADLLGTADWQTINREIEAFKGAMFDVGYHLQREEGGRISEALGHKGLAVLDAFNEKLIRFAELIEAAPAARMMWGYVFKEAFPYLMRSRFCERAYYKPKGYAGDFFMIEMIYRNQPEGDGKLGMLIDMWALEQIPCKAVRGRRRLLRRLLDSLCRERLQGNAPIRIMNLACGPTRELFDLIAACDYSQRIDALCIDIDAEALAFANRNVNPGQHKASIRFMNENVIKWALGRIKHDFGLQDIIYSSGLCDYLDDRLLVAMITRCYSQLKPGGVLIIGNFAPSNPHRYFMDHLLYWRLIYRTMDNMKALFADTPFGDNVQILSEEEHVNLFALAHKV
jgi:extracellular factor (EF) 3-hydroxypalmitic acid methyl ester biosynthesis protein